MTGEIISGILSPAMYKVQNSGRKSRIIEYFHESRSRYRCVAARLEYCGIAGNEGRHYLPGRDRNGEIPRRDEAEDAHGDAHGFAILVRQLRRDGLSGKPSSLACHVISDIDGFLDIAKAFLEYFPHFP